MGNVQIPNAPANMNQSMGMSPHKLIWRLEYNHLLKRFGFSLEVAHAIVCYHGNYSARKLSHLKPEDVDILFKTLCSPVGEYKDGTKTPALACHI